jgi:hypothetical protein
MFRFNLDSHIFVRKKYKAHIHIHQIRDLSDGNSWKNCGYQFD